MSWYERPTILSSISKNENYIFIDESGDIKDLKSVIKKIHKNENVSVRDSNFVLTGIYTPARNLQFLYASFNELKMKYFNRTFPFHANEIDRNDPPYSTLGEKVNNFRRELNNIMCNLNMRLFALQ